MTQPNAQGSESRLERRKRALVDIDGETCQNVVAALADIAPDFATYLIEFPFDDIYSRLGLIPRDREIATITALAATGNAAPPPVESAHQAGLNIGLTRDEITEILMQMPVYAMFPAAPNGLFEAKEVFAAKAGTDVS